MRAQPIERASKTDIVTKLSGDIRHYIRRRDDVVAAQLVVDMLGEGRVDGFGCINFSAGYLLTIFNPYLTRCAPGAHAQALLCITQLIYGRLPPFQVPHTSKQVMDEACTNSHLSCSNSWRRRSRGYNIIVSSSIAIFRIFALHTQYKSSYYSNPSFLLAHTSLNIHIQSRTMPFCYPFWSGVIINSYPGKGSTRSHNFQGGTSYSHKVSKNKAQNMFNICRNI